MKRRSWVILVIVLIALLCAFILASRRPYLAKQTLPDGTIMTLVAIKIGDKHFSPLARPITPPGDVAASQNLLLAETATAGAG